MLSLLLHLLLSVVGHAATPPRIVDAPVPFGEERRRLTLEYRRAHVDPAATDIEIVPRVIVLHYTGGGSAQATMRYFARDRIEAARPRLQAAGEVNVLAHFVVDRDGTIYRLAPETTMGRHTIGLNHLALGVENVGDGARWPLTAAQVEANAALVRDLVARHPTITTLIAHSEYRRLEGTPLFVERDPRYRNEKGDPGEEFMLRVRARVADLGLAGPP